MLLDHRTVMIVDDDATVCQALSAVLASRGYVVSVRSQALGTSAAILRDRPQVIVLDVEMPGLNGDAIPGLLAKSCPSPPLVIFHSSRPSWELARIVRETNALGAIPKGDPRDFLRSFEDLLIASHRMTGRGA